MECPLCYHVNECCRAGRSILLSHYRQFWHYPFVYEISDYWLSYHCQNCRFTIERRDFLYVFMEHNLPEAPPPLPEDIQYAKDVLGTFNFSHLHEKYKDKDLPRYHQKEIMRTLYSKGFKNTEWRMEQMGLPDTFFVKLNFIIGYEYLQVQCYDEAKAAFRQALFELNRSRDKMRKPQPPDFEYYLYLGSLNYFLGRPNEAILDYERGMKLVDRSTRLSAADIHTQLYLHNCFYQNSVEVLGTFWDHPIRFLFQIRNIFFMRAFHIPFDSTLLAILALFILAGLWIITSKFEKSLAKKQSSCLLFYLFTVPATLTLTGLVSYHLDFQYSLRSLLFITGLWSIFFLSVKKVLKKKSKLSKASEILLSPKYKILYAATLLLPWVLFIFVIDDFWLELYRLFLGNAVDYSRQIEWVITVVESLSLCLLIAVGTFTIHTLLPPHTKNGKPWKWYIPASYFFTALLFLIPFWFMLKSRGHVNSDFLFLTFGTSWYILFLLLEKYAAKPIASKFKRFYRLRYAYESSHWKFIRLLFLIYPAAFHIYPKKEYFLQHMLYLLFWPAVSGFIFLLHYLIAQTFKDSRNKLDYSILLTLLSTTSIWAAMELADVSEYFWIGTPGFYLAGGILWLTFTFQYKAYAQTQQNQGKSLPIYFTYLKYNRLQYIIEGSYIILPFIYTIIWCIKYSIAYAEFWYG
jgi:hypothetical protein